MNNYKIFKSAFLFLMCCCFIFFASCNSDERIVILDLAPSTAELAVGGTQSFTVTATYDNGRAETLTSGLVWSSSDDSFVTVSDDGVANAVAAGSATIMAIQTSTGLSALASVIVDLPADSPDDEPSPYTVGGVVSGLSGTLVLQNNLGDDLSVSADGDFTFVTSLVDGADYAVTVLTQPDGQTCAVNNSAGTMSGANVTNVSVTCAANAYIVGGVVSGLAGAESVVLQNNGADNHTIITDGTFTFSTLVAEGAPYNITVLTQPENQTCNVTNGSGTMGGSNVTNISVNCAINTSTLSVSLSELALSVTGLTEYGVSGTPSSGVARTITLTNTGSYTITNLSINYPAWPSGTIASSTCGSVLSASSSCTITVTPGSTATSDGDSSCATSATAPVAQDISMSADNASTVSSAVVILGYGCIYQGGYVFAFDDTTPSSGSVGGKVVAVSDQVYANPTGVFWSSNGANSGSLVSILGIDESSTASSSSPSSPSYPVGTPSFTACNGSYDGACNTANILNYYNFNRESGGEAPTPLSEYAAGVCATTIAGYSDWYLPAICEMDSSGSGVSCSSGTQNILQNISSLIGTNSVSDCALGANCLMGYYWSSTESSSQPQSNAWLEFFASGGGSIQAAYVKSSNLLSVRCVRELAP